MRQPHTPRTARPDDAPGAAPGRSAAVVTTLRPAARTPQLLPSLQARLGERAAATRRAVARRVGLAVAAVAVVAALAWGAFFSPILALDPARVSVNVAAGTVDVAAVEQLAASYAGVPLPRLSTSGLADRIEEVAGVRTAVVERDWPRGLVLDLEARVAVAAVPTEGGMALFDADGVDLGVAAAAPEGIPVVEVPLGEDTSRTLGAALAVASSLPADLRAEVAGLSAEHADRIVLTLADGTTVRWGGHSENELKASVLATLRQIPAQVYDVSTPRRPITE